MSAITYYVALAFKRSEDNGDVVACDPKEARSADQAMRMAGSLRWPKGRSCHGNFFGVSIRLRRRKLGGSRGGMPLGQGVETMEVDGEG
jgi:hypothetical protein